MITSDNQEGVLVVTVDAMRLDSAVGALIRNTVVSALDTQNRVALDISAVKLVDSGGLGALVAVLKSVVNHKGRLVLVGMHQSVRMMFELSRMDRQFILANSLSEAINLMQQVQAG